MKLVNMLREGRPRLGIVTERGVIDLADRTLKPSAPKTMREALELGLRETLRLLEPIEKSARRFLDPEEIEYAPAVDDPEKILCIGTNYKAHILETRGSFTASGAPNVFCKFRNALAPHKGRVIRCKSSQKHDYEAEIAVIVGKRLAYADRAQAIDAIFGCTLANDISARELQKAASQWFPGKGCDSFCPLGPWIVTADGLDFGGIELRGYKNGELRQEGRSSDMIFDIPEIVRFLSNCCTLAPGDVILTGTPSGVILGRPESEQDWLVPGDVLTVSSEQLGELTVTLV